MWSGGSYRWGFPRLSILAHIHSGPKAWKPRGRAALPSHLKASVSPTREQNSGLSAFLWVGLESSGRRGAKIALFPRLNSPALSAGPGGVTHVVVRDDPCYSSGAPLAMGMLAGAATGAALGSLMWSPCWF